MLRLRYALGGDERVVPLVGSRLRLGRGADNDVVLADISVSRNHAELVREGEAWIVEDLGSTNGVELNGSPVERAPLSPGDRLAIGSFQVSIEPGEPESAAVPAERQAARREEVLGNATIVRPLSEFAAAYGLRPAPPKTGEEAYADRMFGFLTRLARILIVADSIDEVLAQVLDIAFEAFPVDRGFILLADDSGELVCEIMRVGERVELHPTGEVPVSRTMLRTVLEERVALVTFDAQADQRLSGGQSILLHQIRAAMCAPLWSGSRSGDRVVGVIQVDSPVQVGAFGEPDLDALTTLANYVAVAVERTRWARQAELDRQVRLRLERYHSPAVIEEVLRGKEAEPGARRLRLAEATVLFADLVGFTSFAESAPPEHVAELLDHFLNLAVEAIFRAGGTLDKFIGDCVMAFFGAPVAQPDHAERAVQAAMEIQRGLAAWNADREAQGLPGFQARVALNSGPVVVGDIGSARRVDYTVLGNTVNVAARLEAFVAKPGDVVIGPRTFDLLAGAVPTEALGEFQLKGLQQRISAYRVVGLG